MRTEHYAGIAASIGNLVQRLTFSFQWIFLKEPKDRASGMTQTQVYQKLVAASQQFRNVICIPIKYLRSEDSPVRNHAIWGAGSDLKSLVDIMPKLMDRYIKAKKLSFQIRIFKINRPEIGLASTGNVPLNQVFQLRGSGEHFN